jgi:betaine-aldehyde dehydrogenase
VRDGLAARLRAVKAGPGEDPNTDMGPMIDKENVARVNKMVEAAIAQGAEVLVRGGPVTEGTLAKGAFYQPTLLAVTDDSLDIVLKETFGPVATIQVFDTEAEAAALANQTEYGLAASVWTRDVDRPWRMAQAIQAGTIWINDWAVVYDECEEGGYNQSGIGRLNGLAAVDAFTEFKHITLNAGAMPG